MRHLNRLIYALPVLISLFLGYQHFEKQKEESTPQFIEKPLPYFEFPEILSKNGENDVLSNSKMPDRPILLNIFGSWCPTCKLEHPQLLKLANMNKIEMYGIAYRDTEEGVRLMMQRDGDIFDRVALDTGINVPYNFNFIKTPQTYIIDRNHVIRYQHAGPISEEQLYSHILPAIEEVSKQ